MLREVAYTVMRHNGDIGRCEFLLHEFEQEENSLLKKINPRPIRMLKSKPRNETFPKVWDDYFMVWCWRRRSGVVLLFWLLMVNEVSIKDDHLLHCIHESLSHLENLNCFLWFEFGFSVFANATLLKNGLAWLKLV